MKNNLEFLDTLFATQDSKYKKQQYLKSNFDENIWSIKFPKLEFKIDFNIELSDGGKLTSNLNLLNTVKYWILANTLSENGIENAQSATNNRIKCVISMFDFINIHFGEQIKISKFGLKLLTDNHVKEILHNISRDRFKQETIYEMSKKLKEFFLDNIRDESLNDIILTNKFLSNNLNSTYLNLTERELLLTRAFLFKNNLYKNSKTGKMIPTLISILERIYKNKTLASIKSFAYLYPEDLIFDIEEGSKYKEKESMFDDFRGKELLSEGSLHVYKKTLNNLNKLNANDLKSYGLLSPSNNIFKNTTNIITETKTSQRFKTVPSHIVFNTIRKAVEFHFELGEEIITSYKNVASYMMELGLTKITEIPKDKLNDLLTSKLKGKVEYWNIVQQQFRGNKFQEIRDGKSLYFLLMAYYGATQFVTGAVMARRQSEMISLKTNESVDYINKIMYFKRSKSTKNIFGVKDTIGLPIDEMALNMIKNIEEIQNFLLENNLIKENKEIFTPLSYNNLFSLSKNMNASNYNNNLDIFYDYVEVECEGNKRYYMRQHQLRRFFAMAFFWGNGFGSMDTLRWFLGHTDVQHLYHYITESTEGSVLKSVKAQYAYETLEDQKDLKNLLLEKYGTENFSLIEREVLEDYIAELIEENKVEVEPEFFKDDNGQDYKILVKIKGK